MVRAERWKPFYSRMPANRRSGFARTRRPLLQELKMIYCFDIDGTICSNTDGEYEAGEPNHEMIAEVNRLYSEGHTIVMHTARGSTTGLDWRDLTARQLDDWGVRYHALHMGKPMADIYVDDKAINVEDWKTNQSNLPVKKLPPDGSMWVAWMMIEPSGLLNSFSLPPHTDLGRD